MSFYILRVIMKSYFALMVISNLTLDLSSQLQVRRAESSLDYSGHSGFGGARSVAWSSVMGFAAVWRNRENSCQDYPNVVRRICINLTNYINPEKSKPY